MPNEPYSREITDLKFQEIMHKCNEILEVAKETREQAKMTNGRVTTLEKVNEKRKGATDVLKIITGTALLLLVTYLTWLGKTILDVKETLSMYNIEIIP